MDRKLSKQRDIEILVLVVVITYMLILLFDAVNLTNFWLGQLYNWTIFIVMSLPSVAAYKLQGKKLKDLLHCEKKQLRVVGILLLVRLALLLLGGFTGLSPIGMSYVTDPVVHIVYLFRYVCIVAVCEEFIYRIYIQETLVDLFGKYAALAPAVAAVIFGVSHIINGNMNSVIIGTLWGLIWGYTRYFDKKCTYTALVLTHGLSNYLIYILAVLNFAIFGTKL